jgi:hypothetical protein
MLSGLMQPLVKIGSARTPAVITKDRSAFMRLSSNPGNFVRRVRAAYLPVVWYRPAIGADFNEYSERSGSAENSGGDDSAQRKLKNSGKIAKVGWEGGSVVIK